MSTAPTADPRTAPVLEVVDLRTEFRTDLGVVHAVDGVTFSLEPAQTLALVGESGSGKSVTCLTIMGLLSSRSVTISGDVRLRGRSVIGLRPKQMRQIRGAEMTMIFQDPMTSLNPAHRVGAQLAEAIKLHGRVSKRQARRRALDALKEVGIPDAQSRIDDFPHQFSGGMRQRVMIAMALINNPALLIADEPTTALDVTTQAKILKLIRRLQDSHGMSILFVTHDLGVVAQIADHVAVMYAGEIIERSSVRQLFTIPRHPYTWGLLRSVPRANAVSQRLEQIPGGPPSMLAPPPGCRFAPRCPHRMRVCDAEPPRLATSMIDGEPHAEACHLDEEAKRRRGGREAMIGVETRS